MRSRSDPDPVDCRYVLGLSRRNKRHSKRIGNMHVCELEEGHSGNHLCPVCGLTWACYDQDALRGLQEAPQGPLVA